MIITIKMIKTKKLEDMLITLKNIKCPPQTKIKLRKAANNWINYIRRHISEIHELDVFNGYHKGEISFIEFFFNIKEKREKDYGKKIKN